MPPDSAVCNGLVASGSDFPPRDAIRPLGRAARTRAFRPARFLRTMGGGHPDRDRRTMPIVERDPWRMQYFEHVACPDEVFIPTEDSDAYAMFPQYRWIYNKLLVAESQGMDCGLHGMAPHRVPGVLQAGLQHARHGRGQPDLPHAARLPAEPEARAHVDGAAQGRARQHRRRGGRRRAQVVAPRHRQLDRRRHVRLLDRAGRRRARRSRATAATGCAPTSAATPA